MKVWWFLKAKMVILASWQCSTITRVEKIITAEREFQRKLN
jgi:hypothetical protein